MKSVSISLDFGVSRHEVGLLSCENGRCLLAIQSLPFPIRGVTLGTSSFLESSIPFLIRDALPDSWGDLVMHHQMSKIGMKRSDITLAHRLSYVGNTALGAWKFSPVIESELDEKIQDLDWLHNQSIALFENKSDVNLDWMAGSVSLGGARPKVFADVIGDDISLSQLARNRAWIVKLPGNRDYQESGNLEYMYALIANDFKLNTTKPKLLKNKYFATKRFDRNDSERFLLQSLSSVNQLPHTNSLDNSYESAIDALSEVSLETLEQIVRLIVFNKIMLNRDDHAKNISFLYDHKGAFTLAPFYDLTYATALGSHGMSLNRESWFELHDIVESMSVYGVSKKEIIDIVDELRTLICSWEDYLDMAKIDKNSNLSINVLSDIKSELKEFPV